MNNVLYEPLPNEWNGYEINTSFQVGVQLSVCFDDEELTEEEKIKYAVFLLFSNDDGSIREFPTNEDELSECFSWFMGGWNHDHTTSSENEERLIDYNVDQGRIYADFLQIYHININNCELHWWEFQWLLWNMPRKLSSFMQVIEIRTKKPSKRASSEERKAIAEGKKVYGLSTKKKQLTEKEKSKIDEYDEMMKKIKEQNKQD